MIIDFVDSCWQTADVQWNRNLAELLALLARRQQHAILAKPALLLNWCKVNLPYHEAYYIVRLSASQIRQNALTIKISPLGVSKIIGGANWVITAHAAFDVINKPLQVFLENNQSDKIFMESAIPEFRIWCELGWIVPEMGGGSAMEANIADACWDFLKRIRSFYLFDSDRLHPDELDPAWKPPGGDGCQGYNFEKLCANMPARRWHMLRRRSIENYLPKENLDEIDAVMSSHLFDQGVGDMADHYNMKQGLVGDGVRPPIAKQAVRASRSKGFWSSLDISVQTALQDGFGKHVAKEFGNIPQNYSWPASIISEMSMLSDAIQDAM